VGSAGNDVLTGGGGQDLLIAGAGDDDILSDADYVPPGLDWRVVDAFPTRVYPQATGRRSPADSAGDVIYAGDGKDFVLAGAGGDVVYGEGGNDYIYGNDGSDILLGGSGDDTLIGDNGDGTGVEGDDYLDGGDGSNRLLGGAGNDTLIAHGGNNYLDGGEGRDGYIFDAGFGTSHIADSGTGGNAVQFNFNFAGSGIALGLGSLSFANGDELYIDNFNPNDPLNSSSIDTFIFADRTLSLQDVLDLGVDVAGSADADIFQGSAMNERIVALAGDDTLLAGGGNDSLDAGAGNDYLDGGTGSDLMLGGQGNDTYVVDNAGDTVTENLNEGIDLAQSGISYTLTDNVENLVLTGATNLNGTGNALANTITGNSGINMLDGGLGADTLIGGAGNDNYVVDNIADVVVEQAGEGTDSVYASVDYSLSDNVENLNLTGTANINGAGNDNVLGGAGNDWLYGDGSSAQGNDTLDGGDDTLLGGAGTDYLDGQDGNDTYVVDNVGDVVNKNHDESIDLVQANIRYTLSLYLYRRRRFTRYSLSTTPLSLYPQKSVDIESVTRQTRA